MLIELDVKNNRLTELPGKIKTNSVEFVAIIWNSYITHSGSPYTADIGNLENLLVFSLTNNHISFLPKSIGRLAILQELSLQ